MNPELLTEYEYMADKYPDMLLKAFEETFTTQKEIHQARANLTLREASILEHRRVIAHVMGVVAIGGSDEPE